MRRNADAYLVEYGDGECAIVNPDDYDYDYTRSTHLGQDVLTIVAALEYLRSYDHGARTAEELDMDRCADGAAYIMSPLLALMLPAGAPWHPGIAYELAMAYIVENYHMTRRSGLWCCEDGEDAQGLFELWDYHVAPALCDVGYIVESSGDAGMTWIYRPMEEER